MSFQPALDETYHRFVCFELGAWPGKTRRNADPVVPRNPILLPRYLGLHRWSPARDFAAHLPLDEPLPSVCVVRVLDNASEPR